MQDLIKKLSSFSPKKSTVSAEILFIWKALNIFGGQHESLRRLTHKFIAGNDRIKSNYDKVDDIILFSINQLLEENHQKT